LIAFSQASVTASPRKRTVQIVAFLGLSLFVVAFFQTGPFLASVFSDVSDSHPYAQAASFLQRRGIIRGFSDGTFRPDASVSRAELVKILALSTLGAKAAVACDEKERGTQFTDIVSTDWFAPFVCAGKKSRLLSGYGDGGFRPAATVNVAEAAKFIVSFFHLPVDADKGEWYKPFLTSLAERHALPPTLSGVTAPLKRGELAEILFRLQTNDRSRDAVSYEDLVKSLHAAAPVNPSLAVSQLFLLLNEERGKRGLLPLTYNASLEKAAMQYVSDMEKRGFFDHDSPEGIGPEQRIRDIGYIQCSQCGRWTYRWGETLGEGRDAKEVMDAWMSSPIHSSIVFSSVFTEAGMGRAGDKWVADFGVILRD
jgi:hypothetical protein